MGTWKINGSNGYLFTGSVPANEMVFGMAPSTTLPDTGEPQGCDGWVVLFHRVPPALERWSAGQVVTGRFAEGAVASERGIGPRSRVN